MMPVREWADKMDQPVLDSIIILFAVLYYAFLCAVYLLRGLERTKAELLLAPVFSMLLVPFVLLEVLNLVNGADILRLVTLLPIIIYLVYDLWYRLLTKKKPVHHPKKWPRGLVLYLILLQAGSIGLNWYGYLVSRMHGIALVACFFIMLGCFGFYQGRHNKRTKSEQQAKS